MTPDLPGPGAVVLAAGRGTRMQRPRPDVALNVAQRDTAERGTKALIPFAGEPFLAYVLSALADAGLGEACLVVGPGADPIRSHFSGRRTTRIELTFAVQAEPLGSADAVLSAEDVVGGRPFLVINADNLYPPGVVARVAALEGSGLAGFRREALVAGGIPPERIAAFAIVEADERGDLARIVEKPGRAAVGKLGNREWISMTCWRFEASIFEACRAAPPSSRGEYELPDAVAWATRRGDRFRIVPADEAVLDLTSREDIPRIADQLRGARVRL